MNRGSSYVSRKLFKGGAEGAPLPGSTPTMKSDWSVGTTSRRSLLTPPSGYNSTLKMEATDSLETLLAIRET